MKMIDQLLTLFSPCGGTSIRQGPFRRRANEPAYFGASPALRSRRRDVQTSRLGRSFALFVSLLILASLAMPSAVILGVNAEDAPPVETPVVADSAPTGEEASQATSTADPEDSAGPTAVATEAPPSDDSVSGSESPPIGAGVNPSEVPTTSVPSSATDAGIQSANVTLGDEPGVESNVLTVHVVDSQTQAPIPDATVTVHDFSWLEVFTGMTDATGAFTTGELLGSEYDYNAQVSAAGYLDNSGDATVNGPTELTVALQSIPTGALTLYILDQESGAPIEGAAITVRDSQTGNEVASGSSDADGVFVTGELPLGEYVVDVAADEYHPGNSRAWVNGPSEYTIYLSPIPRPGTLTVHAIDQVTGEPIEGATVVVFDASWTQVATGVTDGSGALTTGELAGGQYYAEVSADHYVTQYAYPDPFVDGSIETTVALDPILPGTVTITVLDQVTGAPVAGATVVVRDYWGGGIESATGTTDAQGVFVSAELPATQYSVDVSAEHYLPGYAFVSVDGPVSSTVSLTAKFPGIIKVTAIDQTSGAPIAGATVVAYDREQTELARGTTDADGIFVTPELPGGNTDIVISAQGYFEMWTYRWLNGSTELTVSLVPMLTGDLTVTALHEWDGSPVAGASVVVRDHFSGAEVASGSTDGDGNFVAPALPGGQYDVLATTDGFFDASSSPSVNGSSQVYLALRPKVAGTLTVTVIDVEFTEPIANAVVTVVDAESGVEVATGTTDASGIFTTETLEGALYDVTVAAAGFEPGEVHTLVSGTSMVELRLWAKPGHLTVQVVDQVTGAPIPGATVSVRTVWEELATGSTDAAGEFVTDELPPAEYYLEVTAEGYFQGIDRPRVSGDTVFVLALEPRIAGALTVTVVDYVTGDAIRGAVVVVEGANDTVVGAGITGNSGTFTTTSLPGDFYSVEVTADGYRPNTPSALVSGPSAVTVSLQPAIPGRITLSAVDAETGEPIAGATVEVRDDVTGTHVDSGTTKQSGSFRTGELPAGYYLIEIAAEGYFLSESQVWVEGDTEFEVWMREQRAGTLTVRTLEEESGIPIANATVIVYEPSTMNQVATGLSDDSGVFVTPTLDGGVYYFTVAAPDHFSFLYGYASVPSDSEQTVYLQSGSAGPLQATVIEESSGNPIVGATVVVRDLEGAEVTRGITDSAGVFVSAELPAAEYSVVALAEGYFMYGVTSVRVDGPAELTLAMITGQPGTVSLMLLDWSTHRPIVGATIVVVDGLGAEVERGITDSSGGFFTSELPTGEYRFDVSHLGYGGIQNYRVFVNGPIEKTIGMTLTIEASLSLSIDAGAPGTKLKVDGAGFAPGELVTLSWQDLGGTVIAHVTANKDGTISTNGVVIPDVPAGKYRLVAVGSESEVVAVAAITVTTPVAPKVN
jgi:5-hydroxyisourate hydrolase-like protein (transthyretin family)